MRDTQGPIALLRKLAAGPLPPDSKWSCEPRGHAETISKRAAIPRLNLLHGTVDATENLNPTDEALELRRIVRPISYGTPSFEPISADIFSCRSGDPQDVSASDKRDTCRCSIYEHKRALIACLERNSIAIIPDWIPDSMLTGHIATIATRDPSCAAIIVERLDRTGLASRGPLLHKNTTTPDMRPSTAYRYGSSQQPRPHG